MFYKKGFVVHSLLIKTVFKMKKITLLLVLFIPFLGISQYNITFQVDMNQYSGFTTPEVNGEFNNWCGNCAPMSDVNADGIWDITVPITADSIEYKFSHDNWAGQETLTPGSPCTKTSGSFTNRFLVITGDTTLPAVCWESCAPCTGSPTNADVTFQVDLSQYTGGSFSQVNLNGTFNNWCGSCAVMTDADNDMIYELTVNVSTLDTLEFKYTLDGWTTEEQLTSGDPCTKTTVDAGVTYVNRMLVASTDTTLPPVCWESCATCSGIGIEESNWIKNLAISPNPNNGLFTIVGSIESTTEINIVISDIQGRAVYTDRISDNRLDKAINLSNLSSGLYIVNLFSELGTTTEKIIIER